MNHRKSARLASLLLALAAAAPAPAQQEPAEPELDVHPAFVELQEEVARVPFTLGPTRPIPVVEAMVNGRGPFRFFFDTGASVCVLDSGFVDELGIEVVGTTEIGDPSASARIAADRVMLESLELEGVLFQGVPAVAFDRRRFGGDTIRGVLGLPLFHEHLLTVDYAHARVEVRADGLPEEGPGILPYTGELLPEFPITIGGEVHPCHVDSGSPGGFTLPARIVEGLPHKTEPKVIGMARTVNSEFEVRRVQLATDVVLAGVVFHEPEVEYNELLPNPLIGYRVLKDLVLSIDQRSKRIRFVPASAEGAAAPAAASPAAERRRLGAAFAVNGESMPVTLVVAGSAAERAGLAVDDLLLRVDGAEATPELLAEALEGAKPIRLQVRRGGETLELVAFADAPPEDGTGG